MLANPPSLDLLSDSGIESATVEVETPSGNSIQVTCNSIVFGAGLNAQSCSNAVAKSPTGERQESWAIHSRGGLNPPADVILPLAVVSDDAACLMVPFMRPHSQVTGHASAMNVSDAARAILHDCVIRRRLGGLAFQIGGDNRVGVVLTQPPVQPTCAGTGTATTPPSSCRYIMDEMDKTHVKERFGRTGAVDFALPLTLRAPDGKCQVVIDTESPQFTVTTSWYKIWVAVEGIVTLCVDNGKSGRGVIRPQAGRRLSVSVMDEPDPSKVIAVSVKNASNESIYRA